MLKRENRGSVKDHDNKSKIKEKKRASHTPGKVLTDEEGAEVETKHWELPKDGKEVDQHDI